MIRGPALLLAGALGCSRASPVGPAPEAPKIASPAPVAAVKSGVYKLFVGATHEISCSQSFQTDSEYTAYELTLGDDGSVSLAVTTHSSHVFGPSSSKFSGGPATKDDKLGKYRFVGRTSSTATFEGAEEKSGAKVRLTCTTSRVAIDDHTVDAGKATIDAISCAGLPFMPDDGRTYFKGPAPLALGTGLALSVHDFGHGSAMITLHRGF